MKRFFALFFAAAIFTQAAILPAALAADQSAAAAPAPAQIQAQLTEILNNQKQILARLDEMKQELYIIKVRASR